MPTLLTRLLTLFRLRGDLRTERSSTCVVTTRSGEVVHEYPQLCLHSLHHILTVPVHGPAGAGRAAIAPHRRCQGRTRSTDDGPANRRGRRRVPPNATTWSGPCGTSASRPQDTTGADHRADVAVLCPTETTDIPAAVARSLADAGSSGSSSLHRGGRRRFLRRRRCPPERTAGSYRPFTHRPRSNDLRHPRRRERVLPDRHRRARCRAANWTRRSGGSGRTDPARKPDPPGICRPDDRPERSPASWRSVRQPSAGTPLESPRSCRQPLGGGHRNAGPIRSSTAPAESWLRPTCRRWTSGGRRETASGTRSMPALDQDVSPADRIAELGRAELRVVELVADGLNNREIAEQLFLSRHTIESHLKRVYAKLHIRLAGRTHPAAAHRASRPQGRQLTSGHASCGASAIVDVGLVLAPRCGAGTHAHQPPGRNARAIRPGGLLVLALSPPG